MKEESDTSNEVLERLASCHLMTNHSHLLSSKQESPPLASSSPSPTSVSSITSIPKVSSSTNGNGTSMANVSSLNSPIQLGNTFDMESLVQAHFYENALAAAAARLTFSGISDEQSRLLLMQGIVNARNALSSTSSTRSKSSASSDGSNGGSPISSMSMSIKSKSKSSVKARSLGTNQVASSTSNREKVFVCQICNRSFGYKHVLQNHERTHTGEKPFECRECHKRFTRDHHLKTHMRLHTGEKPYHCNHCDRQFVQVANLRRHLRVHTGEKPYGCELCTSRFSDSNQLKAHMLIHKGEKPFQCKKCEGRFRRRHHLMHHKCPKDEANLGKPRRGRRPKAYEQLHSASPNSLSSSRPPSADELLAHLPLLTATAAVTSTTANSSSNFFHHGSKPPSHHLPHLRPPSSHHLLSPSESIPPTAHHFGSTDSAPKSRRKPRHTNRILPESEHEHLFNETRHEDDDEQPLNLSISPGLTVSKQLVSQLSLNARRVLNGSPRTAENDVLDLSRSRSDAESEPEPIEEDIEDEEMEEITAKEEVEVDDEVVVMHNNSNYLENGQSYKSHLSSLSKHFSGNGITALNLAAFGLDKLKLKKSNSNGTPMPLIKSDPTGDTKTLSVVTE